MNEATGGTNQTAYAKGDLIYSPSTNALARLPIATVQEQILGAGVTGIPYWRDLYAPLYESFIFDDMDSNGPRFPWVATQSGTGAGAGAEPATDGIHTGIFRISTGTTSTGLVSRYNKSTLKSLLAGSGWLMFETVLSVSALSTSADEYVVRVGFGDGYVTGVDATDGVYFVYDRATNGDFWTLKTASNSSRTTTVLDGTAGNPTSAVTGGSWYKLKAIVNAAGTQVDFYINNVLMKSHTTNIPNVAGREFGEGVSMLQSAYTSVQKFLDWDYYLRKFVATTSR